MLRGFRGLACVLVTNAARRCAARNRAGLSGLGADTPWQGCGFTMSLFIAEFALDESSLAAAKIGVLAGSAICAVAGMGLMVGLLGKVDLQRRGAKILTTIRRFV